MLLLGNQPESSLLRQAEGTFVTGPQRGAAFRYRFCGSQDRPSWGKPIGQSHQVAGDLLRSHIQQKKKKKKKEKKESNKLAPLGYRAHWSLAKTKGSFKRSGREIRGLESEGAEVEREREPGEGMMRALHHTPRVRLVTLVPTGRLCSLIHREESIS